MKDLMFSHGLRYALPVLLALVGPARAQCVDNACATYIVSSETGSVRQGTGVVGPGAFTPAWMGIDTVHDVTVFDDATASSDRPFVAFDRYPVGDPGTYVLSRTRAREGTLQLVSADADDPAGVPDNHRHAVLQVGSFSTPALADLDADGDADLVIGSRGSTLLYFENTGTTDNPAFTERTGPDNPFDGLPGPPAFADLDADGDFDFVSGLRTFEYIGSPENPVFAVTNLGAPNASFADLDGDGDLDAVAGESTFGEFFYFENTGTPESPLFVPRLGEDNPYDGFSVGQNSAPALADLNGDGVLDLVSGAASGEITFFGEIDVATEPVEVPGESALSAAHPNPFDEQTRFTLVLDQTQHVRAGVYDALGRRVALLYDGLLQAGTEHTFVLDGRGWSSGLYVYEIAGEQFRETGTVMLVK